MVWDASGERVLVTGASSGIGEQIACAMARAGATVGICARRTDRLNDVLARLRQWAPDSQAWTVDLADLDGIAGFAARVEADLGRVDVLINNAGVPKRRRLTAITPEELESHLAVNLLSPIRLTLALLAGMVARGHGRIVNISSMGTRLFAPGIGAYVTGKHGLAGFTEGLHMDLLGSGVTAQLFVPGTTRSEFSTHKDGNDPPYPMPPEAYQDPADVASALLDLLATDDYEGFANERDRATALRKGADPNAFAAQMRELFGGRTRP